MFCMWFVSGNSEVFPKCKPPSLPELTDPLKVVDVLHLLFDHVEDHIAGVHLNHDESRQHLTPDLRQRLAHQLTEVI